MKVILDFKKLNTLLKSFYDITNIRYSILDPDFNVAYSCSEFSDFCSRINATSEGHKRCIKSDTEASQRLTKNTRRHIYSCHAGVTEAVIPVIGEGEIVAYLIFGQILSGEENVDSQWKTARKNLSWYKNVDSLEDSFKHLNVLDIKKIEACSTLLRAFSSYIWLEGMIKTASLSNTQRIYTYIDAHYNDKITLDEMSDVLKISKTQICMLAKKKDTTIMKIIRNKRIDKAKILLEVSDFSISKIAETVGIDDYNYFSKVFKSIAKVTPRNYRKQFRKGNSAVIDIHA